MSVADAEDESGDAVARAAEGEGLDGLLDRVLVVLPDPLVKLRRVNLKEWVENIAQVDRSWLID